MIVSAADLRVVKLDYSRNPWRLVTRDGEQLGSWQEYPSSALPRGVSLPPFMAPVCFRTKREAVAALRAMLERAA